jgi:predicted acyltransferase
VLDKQGNFAQWIDSLVLTGHMWSATKTWDPEGIVSTLPAVGTVLFGIFAGLILRSARGASHKVTTLMGLGALLVAAGQVMGIWLPINKNLWTTSFAVFMAGMATLVFAVCYWVVDIKGWRTWSRPFAIYGMNAITVYVLSGLLARLLWMIKLPAAGESVSLWTWIYTRGFEPIADPYNASLLFAVSMVLALYLVAYGMYRRGWVVKV